MHDTTPDKSPSSLIHRFLHVTLLVFGLSSAPASAAIITLDLTTDIFAGTVTNIVDVGGFAGERWESASLGFTPITINQGDQLNLNVLFSAGQNMELASGSYNSGREYVGFHKVPISSISLQAASTLTSFSGLTGDLDVALPFTSTFSGGNQLAGIAVSDMTDTAISFAGFSLSTTYTVLTGAPVTISDLNLFAAAEDITLSTVLIPEPGTLALLIPGLLGAMRVSRRRGG